MAQINAAEFGFTQVGTEDEVRMGTSLFPNGQTIKFFRDVCYGWGNFIAPAPLLCLPCPHVSASPRPRISLSFFMHGDEIFSLGLPSAFLPQSTTKTTKMNELWLTLENWLAQQLPEVLADLNPGCSNQELNELEHRLNVAIAILLALQTYFFILQKLTNNSVKTSKNGR